jgi:hypothetical protein
VRIATATISWVALRHDREHVAHEVDAAPLPASADQHRPDGGFQAGVRI